MSRELGSGSEDASVTAIRFTDTTKERQQPTADQARDQAFGEVLKIANEYRGEMQRLYNSTKGSDKAACEAGYVAVNRLIRKIEQRRTTAGRSGN